MTINGKSYPFLGIIKQYFVQIILICVGIPLFVFWARSVYIQESNSTPAPVPYWSFVSDHKNLSVLQVKQILDLTARCSAITGVRQSILLSIIEVESDYEPDVRANNDIGLCQINSRVWWFADFDIERNINGMCVILSHYLLFEHGSVYRAVRRYNGINSDAFASRVLSGARKIDEQK